jgi:hypothetical protein
MSKFILCNYHATTLALVIDLTWNFTYGFALRLKTIASFASSFAFAILIVNRFVETKF